MKHAGTAPNASLAPLIEVHDWSVAEALVTPLRLRVFVIEQGVPLALELDELDAVSRHAIAFDQDRRVCATGRLLPDGHIGRMAVDAGWRRRGVGSAVLETLAAEAARLGIEELFLNAQLTALGFYQNHGFSVFGETFLEAGIPHRAMRRHCRAAGGE